MKSSSDRLEATGNWSFKGPLKGRNAHSVWEGRGKGGKEPRAQPQRTEARGASLRLPGKFVGMLPTGGVFCFVSERLDSSQPVSF